jgi:5,10-methenyltetrahydromethanopterin hydrogenase
LSRSSAATTRAHAAPGGAFRRCCRASGRFDDTLGHHYLRDTAARELDLAVAVAEVYRSDPQFAAPEAVWAGLARALPTLLDPPP